MTSTLNILWVATKPPWPPIDGGRLVMATTIEALVARGHRITVVAPAVGPRPVPPELPGLEVRWVEARQSSRVASLSGSLARREPWTVTRHRYPTVKKAVADLLRQQPFEILWCDQLQALSSIPDRPAVPIVLRMQNVESDLWRQTAKLAPLWQRPFFSLEAQRLTRAERRASEHVDLVFALTDEDAGALRGHCLSAPIEPIAAPFPSHLPQAEHTLPGTPPLVLFQGGWLPNRDGAAWFLRRIWPALDAGPAELHVFGGSSHGQTRVHCHPAPNESRAAFVNGGALVVPLRIGSGVRMKVLEAWARRLPVVATRVALRGLRVGAGKEALVAENAEGFSAAVGVLQSREATEHLRNAGARYLRENHTPSQIASLLSKYLLNLGSS